MSETVQLLGLDFGTTTSSAVVASARLTRPAATGRVELDQVRERYRSPMVFTPLGRDDRLDIAQIEACLDGWLAAGNVHPGEVLGGGALLTGLTAQKENAAALVQLVRRRLGDALVATADDPCLESWLAFMGSCAALSRAHPWQAILNLDIGGGTTNLALGRAGEVLRTGCLFVGARHIQLVPGSYRIVKLSRHARALLDHLGLGKSLGDCLSESEVQSILDFYLGLLEAVALGRARAGPADEPVARLHEQVPFRPPAGVGEVALTLSGGVGELVYAHLQGGPWPPTTHFGDLGIDLARRLVGSPLWAEHLHRYRPASAGRATVYGLLRHSTEVSGSTLFLPRPEILPLADVPILGSLQPGDDAAQVRNLVELARRTRRGACLRVTVGAEDALAVRELGRQLARALRNTAFPADQPLVLLVRENLGKVLGQYVTEWGALPLTLVVIDEVTLRDAQYAHIGAPRGPIVPVSFYGLNESRDGP
jgi:ethanolamine utilization protein EutA